MSNEALKVLDGSQIVGISPPSSGEALTGAQITDLVESAVSSSLFGFSLPQSLKSSALRRIGVSPDSELAPEQSSKTIELYIAAIANELKDDPIVVAVLNGETIRMFLEDEDDFAMIAENLFTDLDSEDKGKIRKSEIRSALANMGAEMGVPPISEFPPLNAILKKHESDGEEELGQAQFALLLQCVLQDLADALAENQVVLVQNIKTNNGSKLRKILADEKQVVTISEKLLQEKQSGQDYPCIAPFIRNCFEKNWEEFGLPEPSDSNEAAILLYDAVFADVTENKITSDVTKDEFFNLVKAILEKFLEQLEVNPVYYDLDH